MNLVTTMKNSDNNIKRIINLMQTDDSVDAPADAIKWSKNIFHSKIKEPKKSVVEKVFAVLQMDLSADKAVFGERSASTLQARQMLFEANENSIDLRISESKEGFIVKGQVLGVGFKNAFVQLGVRDTIGNEMSEFVLVGIKKGTYDLRIKTFEKELIIEKLQID